MKYIASFFAILCLAVGAHAAPRHGVYNSGVSCPYGTDNGCLASHTYASAPAFQDPNLVYTYSTSGQLPTDCINSTTCTVNTNAITNVTALWHRGGYNIPYLDYPIGSNAPGTLAAASSINDATCKYSATGASYGAFPAVVCQQVAGSPAIYTLSGYDFTNLGSGTGTDCAQLYIKGSNIANSVGGATSFVFQNNYHKALNNCFAGTSAVQSTMIFHQSGGTYTSPNLTFYNITCDGNFNNAPDSPTDSFTGYISGTTLTVVTGSAAYGETITGDVTAVGTNITAGSGPTYTVYPSQTVGSVGTPVALVGHVNRIKGRISCINDSRKDASNNLSWPKTFYYSLFINLGHNPMANSTGGDETIYYNAFINYCQGGQPLCHGEIFEDVGSNVTRNEDITGNLITLYPIQNVYNSWTTPFYLSSGQANNVTHNNVYLRNNVIIGNKTNCANAGPFTPSNPCGAQGNGANDQLSGSALFSTQQSNYINSFTVSGNVIDSSGSFSCFSRVADSAAGMVGASIGVLSAGSNFTVTTRPNNYTIPTTSLAFYPGMLISDNNATDIANGWVDATIQTFTGATAPIFSNSGTLCATGAGAPGQAGGGGCGSMLLTSSEPVTVATLSNFSILTAFNALSWSNNWSIGGSYGVSARAVANPGYGPPNNSWSTIGCP